MDIMDKGKKKLSYKKEAAKMKKRGMSKGQILRRLKKMKHGGKK